MNITKQTREYIEQHPNVRDALRIGVVNYSKLSRLINPEKKNFDATVVACRRYYNSIKKNIADNRLGNVLSKSRIESKNKLVSFVIDKKIYMESAHKMRKVDANIVQGYDTVTIIASDSYEDKIKRIFRQIIETTKDIAEIRIKLPEKTKGAGAYLASAIADSGINIIDTITSWTDTIFILDEKDISKAIEVLKF